MDQQGRLLDRHGRPIIPKNISGGQGGNPDYDPYGLGGRVYPS
jgi:hypothetical protein